MSLIVAFYAIKLAQSRGVSGKDYNQRMTWNGCVDMSPFSRPVFLWLAQSRNRGGSHQRGLLARPLLFYTYPSR